MTFGSAMSSTCVRLFGKLLVAGGLLLALGPPVAQAQRATLVSDTTCSPCHPEAVQAADLNGDETADLLFAAEEGIGWYEGRGNGRFSEPTILPTAVEVPSRIHATDLDGDGRTDLLTAAADTIAWHPNQGEGTFSDPKVITTTAGLVQPADLNGDDRPDLLVLNGTKMAWYANQGGGQFADPKMIPTGDQNVSDIHPADLTGDGNLDLLFSTTLGSGSIMWQENRGEGRFSDPKTVTTAATGRLRVNAADLNGDGRLDVLAGSLIPVRESGTVAWYENQGSGTFSEQQVIATEAKGATDVSATDLDGDGDADVLANIVDHDQRGYTTSTELRWYENEGGGTFSSEMVLASVGEKSEMSSAAADLTGDGTSDVLYAFGADDRIAWRASTGDGRFGDERVVSNQVPSAARGVAAVDLNGDGTTDIFSEEAGTLAWYEGRGDGRFSARTTIGTGGAVQVADLNGDGAPDLLSASTSQRTNARFGTIAWRENEGGAFSESTTILTMDRGDPRAVAADLNADGTEDILAASMQSGTIVWSENQGDGGFSEAKSIATAVDNLERLSAADLTGDGAPDVLTVAGDTVGWYENRGNGAFSDRNTIAAPESDVVRVLAVDLDGDETTDVLTARGEGDSTISTIAWYDNQGSGRFSEANTVETDGDVKNVFVGDLDGDGATDLFTVPDRGHGTVAWHRNDGDGRFAAATLIETGAAPQRVVDVHVDQLNGEGPPDLLLLAGNDNFEEGTAIAWYDGRHVPDPAETASAAQPTASDAADADSKTNDPIKAEPGTGVCIYQGASVRTAPGPDGEYVTNLTAGETFEVRDTRTAERGGETKEYSKVRLKGGKTGWVRSDMIATGGRPAAVLEETVLYERPTPMATTDRTFKPMDVVAVVETNEGFVKVKGMRRGEDWWDAGWVQSDALTQTKVDVAVAGLWTKANAEEGTGAQEAAIKQILDTPAFEESVFVDSLKARLE